MPDKTARPEAPQAASTLAMAYGEPGLAAENRRHIAREIIARASEAGFYAHASPELLALLMQVDTDSRIPPELFSAVAELLVWLERVDQGGGPGQG